jgi:hypothetical protein
VSVSIHIVHNSNCMIELVAAACVDEFGGWCVYVKVIIMCVTIRYLKMRRSNLSYDEQQTDGQVVY